VERGRGRSEESATEKIETFVRRYVVVTIIVCLFLLVVVFGYVMRMTFSCTTKVSRPLLVFIIPCNQSRYKGYISKSKVNS